MFIFTLSVGSGFVSTCISIPSGLVKSRGRRIVVSRVCIISDCGARNNYYTAFNPLSASREGSFRIHALFTRYPTHILLTMYVPIPSITNRPIHSIATMTAIENHRLDGANAAQLLLSGWAARPTCRDDRMSVRQAKRNSSGAANRAMYCPECQCIRS